MSRSEAVLPRVVMTGDSITDADRTSGIGDPGLGGPLGAGWVALVARALGERAAVANRGVSGDRLVDVAARWRRDVLDLAPDVVSVAVGINDTRHHYDHGEPSALERFEERYDALVAPLAAAGVLVVLVEPWVVPVEAAQERWFEDLDPRRAAVARVAGRTGAVLVEAQKVMKERAEQVGGGVLVPDGVHPGPDGHRALADAWLAAVDLPGGAPP